MTYTCFLPDRKNYDMGAKYYILEASHINIHTNGLIVYSYLFIGLAAMYNCCSRDKILAL